MNKLYKFINNGSNRTVGIKKNVLASFVFKGLNILVALLHVPVTLEYLDPTRYGIWISLTSIIAWFSLLDIGLGNGLRNKLAEAIAKKDYLLSRKLVSTSYAILILVACLIIFGFLIVNNWIDWTKVLNTDIEFKQELNKLFIIIVVMFSIKFVLQLINYVLIADQKPAYSSLFEFISNSLALIGIIILTKIGMSSLITFGLVIMTMPLIVFIVTNFYFFNTKYKFISPSLSALDFSYTKVLMGTGVQFFLIQIAVVIIFQSSNIIVSNLFSPAEVTPYNITFKYFNIIVLLWSIIMVPLWSAFTEAYVMKDYKWIKSTIGFMNKIVFVLIGIIFLMYISAHYIIDFWTNGKLVLNNMCILLFAIYAIIAVWNNLYSFFLNGIGQTKLQIITALTGAAIHIPLSIILVKYFNFGPEGVALSMIVSLFIFSIFGSLKTYKIISKWKI